MSKKRKVAKSTGQRKCKKLAVLSLFIVVLLLLRKMLIWQKKRAKQVVHKRMRRRKMLLAKNVPKSVLKRRLKKSLLISLWFTAGVISLIAVSTEPAGMLAEKDETQQRDSKMIEIKQVDFRAKAAEIVEEAYEEPEQAELEAESEPAVLESPEVKAKTTRDTADNESDGYLRAQEMKTESKEEKKPEKKKPALVKRYSGGYIRVHAEKSEDSWVQEILEPGQMVTVQKIGDEWATLQKGGFVLTDYLAKTEAEALAWDAASTDNYYITGYCSCVICCGEYSGGPTTSGVMPEAGRTIAVDPSIIPLGTEVFIEGWGFRTAEDTGSAVGGAHIDIFMPYHEICYGVTDHNVPVHIVRG